MSVFGERYLPSVLADKAGLSSLKPSRYLVYCEEDEAGTHVVFSTLTGAICLMSREEVEALRLGKPLNSEAESILRDNGFLVPQGLDEISLVRRAYQDVKRNNETYQLMICPTLECNFRCPYCYEKRTMGTMGQETQAKLMNFVERKLDMGVTHLSVTWYGGEPTLCLDVVISITKAIGSLCANKNCTADFGMITNGYNLDKAVISRLSETSISAVQVTLDGNRSIHNGRRFLAEGSGTFDRIVENTFDLASAGVFVKVRVNIDKTNVGSFEHVQSIFAGRDNIRVYPSVVTSATENGRCDSCFKHEEYGLFYRSFDSTVFFPNGYDDLDFGIGPCRAEREASSIIGPDGRIYKCLNDVGNDEKSIATIEDDGELDPQVVSSYLGRDPFTEPECSGCEYLPQCYGGCIWEYHDKGTHACPPEKHYIKDLLKSELMSVKEVE